MLFKRSKLNIIYSSIHSATSFLIFKKINPFNIGILSFSNSLIILIIVLFLVIYKSGCSFSDKSICLNLTFKNFSLFYQLIYFYIFLINIHKYYVHYN